MTRKIEQQRVEGSVRAALEVRPSPIDGSGLFALEPIGARRKIGDFSGELVTVREGRRRVRELERIALVELSNGHAIDGSRWGNEFRYINHSCRPNTYMRTIGLHVEFYALRAIAAGEELTCNYGETHHDDTRPCTCGSPGCRGRI